MSSVADLTEQAMAPWEKSQPYYHGSVYYRARSLLLLAPTLNIADNDKTLQRPAIRLLLAHRAPFHLVLNDGRAITARAVMLSPKVGRFTLNATQCDVALFDFLPASPEYVALLSHIKNDVAISLPIESYQPILPKLTQGQEGTLLRQDVAELMGLVVHATTGQWPAPLNYDERIASAIRMMETLPLTDISVKRLADAACLSADRFRHLFKETTGCTVSNYARSTAIWRAMQLLDKDLTITEISHAIGFHDVSHLYHAFSKEFGISLSDKLNPRKFRRIRC